MRITLSPQRRDGTLTLEKFGDRLGINGELFDFGPLPEGGYISCEDIPCELIVDKVKRKDGEIEITLILPHGPNPPKDVAFPVIMEVIADGVVLLPKQEEVKYVDSE